jgi:putative DNA methylase
MSLPPFSWRDRPALIEHLFPVQKLSAESFKEQMAGSGKTLTALGSYWKGRKPLILNKACILGCLLPATENRLGDLHIFELLMGFDDVSMQIRLGMRGSPNVSEEEAIEQAIKRLSKKQRETLLNESGVPSAIYTTKVTAADRPEEIGDEVHSHIWEEVNKYLGTSARSFPELVTEIGIARFGRKPKVADVFCGSGQIPFEAARLGCDVYASDLNPIACLLTWGAFNLVGASTERHEKLQSEQEKVSRAIQREIDDLGIEEDGNGWRAKAYLYCLEARCPESGWMVPLIPSLYISKHNKVIAKLVAQPESKTYDIQICSNPTEEEFQAAAHGTIQKGDVVHSPDGLKVYRTRIETIRGDYTENGKNKNRLRLWEKQDFSPANNDIFLERVYCIQWTKEKSHEFRSINREDLNREQTVIDFVRDNLKKFQEEGFIPDMVIEPGDETDRLYRERGWTHWHHLFNPRQLLTMALFVKHSKPTPEFAVMLPAMLNLQSKLCAWHNDGRKGGCQNAFANQALNTLFNYGTRGVVDLIPYLHIKQRRSENIVNGKVQSHPAHLIDGSFDVFITDPPYGDAVKYEEITEFFISWLRKNPPLEFSNWKWDSRRSLAIKGEDDDFRRGMVQTYRRMGELMPDNGIQVLMFTHKSGNIWADLANIIWASGLKVTAAWYVVTETDSALRDGANVTGTVLLILRKRLGDEASFRDDLAWEIETAVKEQIEGLIGLDDRVRQQGSEGLYRDADLQMAGYAAALKVLTSYSQIDGKKMVTEAEAPRLKGRKSFVDELIDFAVQTAVQFLVPVGFQKDEWQKLEPVERFYLKMVDIENQGQRSLDNYINFSKAFHVKHHDQLLADNAKANSARLKLSTEFKSSLMSGDAEIAGTPLRALLYALLELSKQTEIEDVLLHLMENCPNYNQNKGLLVKIADYIAAKRETLAETRTFHPRTEASHARVLAEALRNQRL